MLSEESLWFRSLFQSWIILLLFYKCKGFSQKKPEGVRPSGFMVFFYSLMPSTKPFAKPTTPCIWEGMMILVAFPSATFSMA